MNVGLYTEPLANALSFHGKKLIEVSEPISANASAGISNTFVIFSNTASHDLLILFGLCKYKRQNQLLFYLVKYYFNKQITDNTDMLSTNSASFATVGITLSSHPDNSIILTNNTFIPIYR